MKRAILFSVFFVLCSNALFAQVHGVPPSVTSFTGRSSTMPPVAPSVTSVGPHGFSTSGPCLSVFGCTDPFFRATPNFHTGTVEFGSTKGTHRGHHGRRRGGVQPVYVYSYPYAYPYPVEMAPEPEPQYQPEPEPEGPGLTVFDRRPAMRPAPNPTPSEKLQPSEPETPVPAAVAEPQPARELIPVLIIFKDGHQQEIGNYAIVGDTLYEIGSYTARKIKLADVDLKQTVEKNEERGIEFNLPANLRPTA